MKHNARVSFKYIHPNTLRDFFTLFTNTLLVITCPFLSAAFSRSLSAHTHRHTHISHSHQHTWYLCVCPAGQKKEEKKTTSEIPELLLQKVLISLQELSVLVRRVLVIRQNVLGELLAVPPTLSTVITFCIIMLYVLCTLQHI